MQITVTKFILINQLVRNTNERSQLLWLFLLSSLLSIHVWSLCCNWLNWLLHHCLYQLVAPLLTFRKHLLQAICQVLCISLFTHPGISNDLMIEILLLHSQKKVRHHVGWCDVSGDIELISGGISKLMCLSPVLMQLSYADSLQGIWDYSLKSWVYLNTCVYNI